MFCKWCGLESDTADVCSWCGRPFPSAARPAEQQPAERRGPSVGEAHAAASERQAGVTEARAPAPAVPEPDILLAEPAGGGDAEAVLGDPLDDFDVLPFAKPLVVDAAPPAPQRPVAEPLRREPPTPAAPRPQPAPTPVEQEPAAHRPAPETIPVRKPPLSPDVIPVVRPEPKTEPPVVTPPAQPPPGPIPVRQPTPPGPIPVRATVPPPGEPPAVRPPVSQPPPARPPAKPPLTEPAEPVLDLPPRLDEPEEIVAPAPNRLDLTEAPAVEIPPIKKPAPGPLPAFARPVPQTTVHIPRAGGRTWYCRWCGMESETPDRCSWCHKDLRNLPAGSASGRGPVLAGERKAVVHVPRHAERQPRDGKSPRAPVAPPAPQPAPAVQPGRPAAAATASAGGAAPAARVPAAPQGVPAMGTFQAQKSKYYPDQVVDPVSGHHFNADTGQTTDTPAEMKEDVLVDERAALLRQSAVYLAGLTVGIILCVLATRMLPQWYLGFIAALNVVGGMAMPPLGVAPYGEDDSSDVAIAIPLILVLGPIVGGMAYGVIAIMRQDANPAIVGVFVTYLLIRFPLQWAAGTDVAASLQSLVPFSPPPDGNWGAHLALQWLPFATVAGWYMASFFHKPDE